MTEQLVARSERGQLMLKTAVMMSSDLGYACIRGDVCKNFEKLLLKVEHAYFADAINLFVS